MIRKYSLFILLLLVFIGCKNESKLVSEESIINSYQPQYAKFFHIDYYRNYKIIHITNPWENAALDLSYVISKDSILTNQPNGFLIKLPIEKVAALSSPMVGLMHILQLDQYIAGVTDPELIYNQQIADKVENKSIINLGKSVAINMEQMLMLQPDLIIGSGWDQLSNDYQRMIQQNMNPLLMYDWKEEHPLGKAEWMVLLASFFQMEDVAIKKFQDIATKYHHLKEQSILESNPSVLNGSEYQGIWYSAGGKSYMSQLYRDAGGDYIMKDDPSTGSLMLDFEVVMQKAAETDIWMYTGEIYSSKMELFQTPKYQSLAAVRKHMVYSYHKRMNSRGANDYWETATYRPDLVLQDLVNIFKQDSLEDLYYFKKVGY